MSSFRRGARLRARAMLNTAISARQRVMCVVLLTTLLLAGGASAVAADPQPASIVGSWRLLAQKVDKKADPFTMTFLESGTLEFLSDAVSMTGTYEVDDATTPRRVSLHYRNEPVPWHGIYQFRDGQLWLCFGDAGVPPPVKFEGGKGQALYKLVPTK